MNWEAIGAVGETLGAIAVLVTLVYVAVQVRQNTAQQKREELLSIQHGQNSVVAKLLDPHVMGAYASTADDMSPSIEDRGTCLSFVVQYLNHFQIVHDLYCNGSLEEEQYQLWLSWPPRLYGDGGMMRTVG